MGMPTLHIVCGLPASGKTTLAKQLEHTLPALRLSADELTTRLVGAPFDETKDEIAKTILAEIALRALSLGVDVVLEGGFWYKSERDVMRNLALGVGAGTMIHFLDVPLDELRRRIEQRNSALPEHTYRITIEQLNRWTCLFERPSESETQM
jgi:predicted kinase